jgi:hypothetical protein
MEADFANFSAVTDASADKDIDVISQLKDRFLSTCLALSNEADSLYHAPSQNRLRWSNWC